MRYKTSFLSVSSKRRKEVFFMRKIVSILLGLSIILTMTTASYGAVPEDNTMEPRYVSVNYCQASFSIDEDGLATYRISAAPKTTIAPDRVTATVKIVKVIGGRTVYNCTKTLSFSEVTRSFTGSDSYQLSTNGQYEMKVTFKCYDGTALLETITMDSRFASY